MTHHRRFLLAALALVASPSVAAANDGALYPYGSSIWSVAPPFSASVGDGPTWLIQVPATTVPVGTHWEMNWGCPVAGSEIAAVRFSALRTQAASSLEVQVTGNRVPLWREADAGMPQSPAGGRAYDVPLPGGHCNVHLALWQAEGRQQHGRGFFIAAPRVVVRDVAPPAVGIHGITRSWIGAAGTLRADWSVGDNFGSDGVAQQRILVAGQVRWAGAPGAGNHGLDLPLDGVPDGVQPVQIVADGDGTAGASASDVVHVDRTAPRATELLGGPASPGAVTLSWRAADATSGVASSQAQVNTAADGGTSGEWRDAGGPGGAGAQSVTVAPAMADGVHAWRVVTTDRAGNTAVTAGPQPVVIDGHAPAVQLHDVPAGWVNRLDLDLTATDALQSVLGIGATEVDVNAAADGGESGEWLRRSATATPAGRRVVPVPLTGLASGRHALRVTVRNGGPFASLASEARATLRVDVDVPTISRAVFSPGGRRPMTVAWAASDAHSGVAAATLQWRQGTAWRSLGGSGASDGAGRMAVDASALPNGQQNVRLVIADGAGNVASRTGTVEISGAGVGSIASDALARLRSARLMVRVPGARVQRSRAGAVLVRRVAVGGSVTIRGTLLDGSGRPIVGAEVQARGHRGRIVGRGLTIRGGRFSFAGRPEAGGVVRVGVAVGRELLPRHADATVRLEVRPHLEFASSSDTVGAGGTVVFTGRLSPAPGDLGLGSRKAVVLEWRDPLRRAWRPVVNARLRKDGTFAIPWAFNLRGLTIPVRVTVPQDAGWPLLAATSRTVMVRVT
ncbi:MAG TPA: hypothetical protein PKD59_06435 [Miltoncostaeaceae bacterium]|nr:hypothetical protein [Miltoncostaeaceae bacterium]